MEDKYNIKETFHKKLSFISEELKNYLKNLTLEQLKDLKEYIDNNSVEPETYYFPDDEVSKADSKLIADLTKVDHPVITEANNLYASKEDITIDGNNVYRGEYFYALSKDKDEKTILVSATEPKGIKIEVDQQTFGNNFIRVTNEEFEVLTRDKKKKIRKYTGIAPGYTADASDANVSVNTISGSIPATPNVI